MVSAPSWANQREQQWSVGVENWKRGSHEAEEWLEVRRQLSAIVNVGVSIVAVATSVWWAGGNIDPIWVRPQTTTQKDEPVIIAPDEAYVRLLHSITENLDCTFPKLPYGHRRSGPVQSALGQCPQKARGHLPWTNAIGSLSRSLSFHKLRGCNPHLDCGAAEQ